MNYKFALIAKNIHNSVLPRTYAAYGRDLGIGIDFEIYNIEPEQLDDILKFARENLNGLTITMPYKKRILDYADESDDSAKQCGSSNLFLIKEGRFTAYNTDGWGFIKALQIKGVSVEDKKVVMVGAGGVALSIAYNLSLNCVKRVDVVNIYPDETQQLCSRFGSVFHPHPLSDETLKCCCADADILVNASILGQVGYSDFDNLEFLKVLGKEAVVYDVNYSNPDAKLPSAAKAYGLKTYVGKSMSALQGIRAMEIWTGRTPSDKVAIELVSELERAK